MIATGSARHYNPDWLSDDALLATFVARQNEFQFLRDELARVPLVGSVQHHLLVGPRGAGKTTLLKRLAVAIRRDDDLRDHLIALSFPEELYQVKNLADFWWASCEALAEEFERSGQLDIANRLFDEIDRNQNIRAPEPDINKGLNLLLSSCANAKRRPVLLVDNLDMVFQRIDKSGRKLKNPHAGAYWELREALSTTRAPIIIGGSTRLSEPFTDYDKAFYDFFLPKRLGKLSLDEVLRVLENLADRQNLPAVKQRLHDRPHRIEALYELTGGNPRALGFIFELLRQGANNRAVEDFERLLDSATPYYKARFEDLSEQAQVVMHALAVRRPTEHNKLRFGHTAAEIGAHTDLQTNTVSSQLDILEREGLVEKSTAQGRTQYRIAEQLFRLWLQMRGTRRIRQNVIGLTEFLEAMFDVEELKSCLQDEREAAPLAAARLHFAIAGVHQSEAWQRGYEARGANFVLKHIHRAGGSMEDYLGGGDLSEETGALLELRNRLQQHNGGGLSPEEQDALIGSVELALADKQAYVAALCEPSGQPGTLENIQLKLAEEQDSLLQQGLLEDDLPILFHQRSIGLLPLPTLTPDDVESALPSEDPAAFRAMIWRLVGACRWVRFDNEETAVAWLNWGCEHASNATSMEWADVARSIRLSKQYETARTAITQAFARGESRQAWHELASWLDQTNGDVSEIESALRKAIDIDPTNTEILSDLGDLLADKTPRWEEAETIYRKGIEIDPMHAGIWDSLGDLLANKLDRPDDAEAAYRKAIEVDPTDPYPWSDLGYLLSCSPNRLHEAEDALRRAVEISPADSWMWCRLGRVLADRLNRPSEAESAYRKGIEIDPAYAWIWIYLGNLLAKQLNRLDEAETAYRKAIEADPTHAWAWSDLAFLLARYPDRLNEAEEAQRRAVELDTKNGWMWYRLGELLADALDRPDEAESAYRKGIEADPRNALLWQSLGNVLETKLERPEEAETAYRRGIELAPKDDWIWSSLGDLLADKLDRLDEAQIAYREGIEANPENAWLWYDLGRLLAHKLDQPSEAEAAYIKATELNPSESSYWIALSLFFCVHNRWDEAETILRKSIALASDATILRKLLLHLLEIHNRLMDAIEICSQAAIGDSEHESFYQSRIDTLSMLIETERALETGSVDNVRDILSRLSVQSTDIAETLASPAFVEGLLGHALIDEARATLLMSALNEAGYEQYARPLLLAFEAALTKREDTLDLLEPEVQTAARKIFGRLTANAK